MTKLSIGESHPLLAIKEKPLRLPQFGHVSVN